MSAQDRFSYSSAPVRRIKGIQFGILDPDFIVRDRRRCEARNGIPFALVLPARPLLAFRSPVCVRLPPHSVGTPSRRSIRHRFMIRVARRWAVRLVLRVALCQRHPPPLLPLPPLRGIHPLTRSPTRRVFFPFVRSVGSALGNDGQESEVHHGREWGA